MQRIEATFDKDRLDEIMNAVLALGVPCHLTACEVRYADGRLRHECEYRGVRYAERWEMRARLEVVVADCEAKAVIDLLAGLLDDDRKRDEALLITEVDDALRLRTARRGEIAF
jgi:nitrogen regulatory protein P-II 1